MRNDRDPCRGQRFDTVVEIVHRIGMKVDKLSRYVDRDQLAKAFSVVDVTRHEAVDKESAFVRLLAFPHKSRAGFDGADIAHRRLEGRPLFIGKEHTAPVAKKSEEKHFPLQRLPASLVIATDAGIRMINVNRAENSATRQASSRS